MISIEDRISAFIEEQKGQLEFPDSRLVFPARRGDDAQSIREIFHAKIGDKVGQVRVVVSEEDSNPGNSNEFLTQKEIAEILNRVNNKLEQIADPNPFNSKTSNASRIVLRRGDRSLKDPNSGKTLDILLLEYVMNHFHFSEDPVGQASLFSEHIFDSPYSSPEVQQKSDSQQDLRAHYDNTWNLDPRFVDALYRQNHFQLAEIADGRNEFCPLPDNFFETLRKGDLLVFAGWLRGGVKFGGATIQEILEDGKSKKTLKCKLAVRLDGKKRKPSTLSIRDGKLFIVEPEEFHPSERTIYKLHDQLYKVQPL